MCKKILHLTIKKQWFDLIASGVKKEEYREIKPYWGKRLNRNYDAICFINGYAKDSPRITVELKSISKGCGFTDWGAPKNTTVYILKLGELLEC